jgi:hypothetical protein
VAGGPGNVHVTTRFGWPVDKNEGVVKGEDIQGGAQAPLGSLDRRRAAWQRKGRLYQGGCLRQNSQQMHVFGHDDVSVDAELVTAANTCPPHSHPDGDIVRSASHRFHRIRLLPPFRLAG